MKRTVLPIIALAFAASASVFAEAPPTPAEPGKEMIAPDLSNVKAPDGVWKFENGELTANADQVLWLAGEHENYLLDLEFKTADGTNSGVIVHCTDTKNWIPNSIELQIADPFAEKWAKSAPTWHGGGVFGRLAPAKQMTKRPGEWNRMIVLAKGRNIKVWLNGELTADMDMDKWTEVKKNPDGSDIPGWLSKPAATLPSKGHIGLQGKHGDSTVWFRNVRISPAP
ncbi:MAG: DUF1080 domain-containing protein [Verrucomicrobiales bacterium]